MAFSGCTNLVNIEIPDIVTYLGSNSFKDCVSLKNIVLPSELTLISYKTFSGCKSLEKIIIPNKVKEIGEGAFSSCYGLVNIEIPETVQNIGKSAFSNCTNLLSVKLPEYVGYIKEKTFNGCSNLKEVTLGSYVKDIGVSAFNGCTQLEEINIPQNVTSINDYAFCGCKKIEEISIPENVCYIGKRVFSDCNNLINIYVNQNNYSYKSIDGVLFNSELTNIIRYPSGKINKEYIIPDSVVNIEQACFEDNINLNNIIIPESVLIINNAAFENCKNLLYIKIPSGITEIQATIFSGCVNLSRVDLSDGITKIGYDAFLNCENLNDIKLPNSLVKIETGAFRGCKKLSSLIIPEKITSLSDYTFERCENLKSIIIPKSVTSIDSRAFHYPERLTIYGYCGSYAEKYANQNNIKFITLDRKEESYIVDKVHKYTSGYLYQYLKDILSSNISDDIKFKLLNEKFVNAGLTDEKEGIKYVSEANEYRLAYEYLTTDEIFGASNFFKWIYSPEGAVARAELVAGGLIFNKEIFDYVDIRTYINKDYPGIKPYKEALKEFILGNNEESEMLSNTNDVLGAIDDILEMNNISKTEDMQKFIDNMSNSNSKNSLQTKLIEFIDKYIIPSTNNKDIVVPIEEISDALGYTQKMISFTDSMSKDIASFITLESEIEAYKKYSEFLKTVSESPEMSLSMRIAAQLLLDEIDTGYTSKLSSMLIDVVEFHTDTLNFKSQIASSTGFSSQLAALEFCIFVSNLIVGTGEFIDSANSTLAYAELAALYKKRLEEAKTAFNNNPTTENAWQFFEEYNILWSLRYMGEKKWMEMGEVKVAILFKMKTYGYEQRKEVVDYNMEQLKKSEFTIAPEFEIPDSVMYMKKVIINCPVDVSIYTKEGKLIATLKDNEECDIRNDYGRFAVVKQAFGGEYAKVICQSTDEELIIKSTAVDNGYVDCQISVRNDNNIYSFDKVEVVKGDIINISTDISENSEYQIDKSGDGIVDVKSKFIKNDIESYVPVTSVDIPETDISVECNKEKTISVSVTPANATNKTVQWISADSSIATVENGVVKGIAEGETVIYVKAVDGQNIIKEVKVSVTKAKFIPGDADGDGEVTSADAVLIKKYLAGYSDLNINEEACDVDGDGEITSADVVLVLRYLAGYDVELK